jgi:hypothetical protein
MKKLFFLAAIMVAGHVGFAQQATPKAETAVLVWDSQSFDFGKIKQGTPVTHEFKFTNTGKSALVIANVAASCGCTTPAWSHDPVGPGQQGFVKATYNAGALGTFNKTVTVTANIENGSVPLMIKGEVIAGTVQ